MQLKEALGVVYSLPLKFIQNAHFCHATSKHVKRFKRKYHLGEDGVVCPETWLLLMQVAKGKQFKSI